MGNAIVWKSLRHRNADGSVILTLGGHRGAVLVQAFAAGVAVL